MTDILVISGKQGSGKSTLADAVRLRALALGYDFVSTEKFADSLYELHNYLLNRMEVLTGKPRIKKDGKLLQWLGTEWGRENFGTNVWVDILTKKILNLESSTTKRLVIIDDCRFENEFDAFPDALRVRLDCHHEVRRDRADSWRDNHNHPSETSLDAFADQGKFDLLFNTECQSVEHCKTMIFAQLQKQNWKEKRKQ